MNINPHTLPSRDSLISSSPPKEPAVLSRVSSAGRSVLSNSNHSLSSLSSDGKERDSVKTKVVDVWKEDNPPGFQRSEQPCSVSETPPAPKIVYTEESLKTLRVMEEAVKSGRHAAYMSRDVRHK